MSETFGGSLKEFHNIEYDIQPGDTIGAGLGAELKYDERAPEAVDEQFDTDSEPGQEIFEYFTDGRGNYHSIEEEHGISTDEDGNPVFSEMVDEEVGECIEMALVAMQHVQDEADEVYLVNGSLPDTDEPSYKVPEHAYLILEHSDDESNHRYEVLDPARLIGGEPIRADITGVDTDFNNIELEEDVQDEFESAFGRTYSLQ